jgi:hypothetical protein
MKNELQIQSETCEGFLISEVLFRPPFFKNVLNFYLEFSRLILRESTALLSFELLFQLKRLDTKQMTQILYKMHS